MSDRHIYAIIDGAGNVTGVSDLSGPVDIPEHARVKTFDKAHIGKKLKKKGNGDRGKDGDGFDVLE